MHRLLVFALLWLGYAGSASAVSTTITYQGSLEEAGVPAEGPYDFSFQLRTAAGGNLGSPILLEDVPVVGGVFTVQLDFGASAFNGNDRRLGISVRAGESLDPHTALTPDALLTAAPYAVRANAADEANIAVDVIDYAIDNIDVNFAAIDDRTLANNAVRTDKIANDAVTAAKIAPGAVDTSELALDAVSTSRIADGAVSTTKLASNSVTVAKLLGANYTSPANINVGIAAHACVTIDLPVGGGFAVGDSVILNVLNTMAEHVSVQALGVVSSDVVRMRFCNASSTMRTVSNLQVRMISLR